MVRGLFVTKLYEAEWLADGGDARFMGEVALRLQDDN